MSFSCVHFSILPTKYIWEKIKSFPSFHFLSLPYFLFSHFSTPLTKQTLRERERERERERCNLKMQTVWYPIVLLAYLLNMRQNFFKKKLILKKVNFWEFEIKAKTRNKKLIANSFLPNTTTSQKLGQKRRRLKSPNLRILSDLLPPSKMILESGWVEEAVLKFQDKLQWGCYKRLLLSSSFDSDLGIVRCLVLLMVLSLSACMCVMMLIVLYAWIFWSK